uniref:Argonaute 1 n=1 Tax=Solanum tuberosum TaxID=4113 RepID=M1D2C0_SOLTU
MTKTLEHSTNKKIQKFTFTRSASDSGLDDTSRFRSCVTKSMTGNGSMKEVEDISVH